MPITEMPEAVRQLANRRHWAVSHQHGTWYAYNAFRVIGVDLEVRVRPIDEDANSWWLELRPAGDDAFLTYQDTLGGCLRENTRIERAAAMVRELPNLRGPELEQAIVDLDRRGLQIARVAFGISWSGNHGQLRHTIQNRIDGRKS